MEYEIFESAHDVSVYYGPTLVAIFFSSNAEELAARFVQNEKHLDAVAEALWDS